MPRTPAERQAAYRARRSTSDRKLAVWVSVETFAALDALRAQTGETQREALERLILAAKGKETPQ